MKKNQLPYITLGILIIGTITFYANSIFMKQNYRTTESSDFVIYVKTNDNKIIMKCEKGCAWKELTYTINKKNETQVVDEYGVTLLKNHLDKKNASLAGFLFKVEKTKQGLKLKGIEGTAWIELSFSLRENRFQKIDNLGTL